MNDSYPQAYCPDIMGIVNVTPDSFSDGGQYDTVDKAIAHGQCLIAEGATVLDIGGESTRPGAVRVSIDAEIEKVVPVIAGLVDKGVELSVDTRNSALMLRALDAGASFVNDVSALEHDPMSLEILSSGEARVCLMHMQGVPQTMQISPDYNDVIQDVYDYLARRIEVCVNAGIDPDRIYADVGIGFGKTLEHNANLLGSLEWFRGLGVRLLLGASRKRFIADICGDDVGADQRLAGSLAAIEAGLRAKVDMFRVHDVFETKQYVDVRQIICRDDP